MRSSDFLKVAEGIRGQEMTLRGHLESLKRTRWALSSRKDALEARISDLESEVDDVYEDADEDGRPDYAQLGDLKEQIREARKEKDSIEAQLQEQNAELERTQAELEGVEEEKAQAIFEIQKRARTTAQNIQSLNGIDTAYAGAGLKFQNSLQTSLSALSQAASILGSIVDQASVVGLSGGGFGKGGGSGAGVGGDAGALAFFSETNGGAALHTSAERFSSSQRPSSALTAYHAPQGGSAPEHGNRRSYSSGQLSDHSVLGGFGAGPEQRHGFADWIDPKSYDGDGHYAGSGQEWGYRPYGTDAAAYGSRVMSPQSRALNAYMREQNYARGDFTQYSGDETWQKLHRAAYPENYSSDGQYQYGGYVQPRNPGTATAIDGAVRDLGTRQALGPDQKSLFLDQDYRTVVTKQDITLYQVHAGGLDAQNALLTSQLPMDAMDVTMGLALDRNRRRYPMTVSEVCIPRGTTLNIGKAAPQMTASGYVLPGGMDQILLPQKDLQGMDVGKGWAPGYQTGYGKKGDGDALVQKSKILGEAFSELGDHSQSVMEGLQTLWEASPTRREQITISTASAVQQGPRPQEDILSRYSGTSALRHSVSVQTEARMEVAWVPRERELELAMAKADVVGSGIHCVLLTTAIVAEKIKSKIGRK